jgi:mannose-1-phosphate guanylyltransferase
VEHAVILAGGRGERFWPLSRRGRPKQLLPITSDKTMLEATIDRIAPAFPPDRIWIVTGEEIGDAVRTCVPNLSGSHVLAEPSSNNTCLAIGWAAVELSVRDPDAVLVILSADHAIEPPATFLRVVQEGIRLARSEPHLITIGITPTRAETGYGYIELGAHFATSDGIASYQVEAFREKPDRNTAQDYYFDRRHLWNAGIFVWTAKTLLTALKEHQPEIHAALMLYGKAIGSPRQAEALKELYATSSCISIDKAVLEHAGNVVVIKADIAWDDVGSWLALGRLKKMGADHNVIVGPAFPLHSFDLTIYNETDDLICTLGVSDLVIVRTGDITFVAHKSRIDEIRDLTDRLRSEERWQSYL